MGKAQSIRVPSAVKESLSNAGIDIPVPAMTEWRRGHVEGVDWVAVVRREQTRLDDLEQLASQVQEERERQRAYEQEQQREISKLLAKIRAQAQQELAIARSHVDSVESDAEDSGSEEDCSEEAESGDDNQDDLDARHLGGYGNTSEEEGESEADELEEEEDTLVEEDEEADELEEATEEERSDGEDCSPEETDGEEEEEEEEEEDDDDDDEIYQNQEDARPSIKAERVAQIADQRIPSAQSRYWVPRGRNTGAMIKQESRLSVARALPREPASISADEDDDMRIANGTQLQDERQLNDRMETDSKDELFNRIKSESRIRAQDSARFENNMERTNVVKSYYPCNPRSPIAFADSVTLRFVSPEDWERRWQRAQRRTSIRMVIFEPSFAVTV
ncbi:hypothetical protein J4E93_005008 [Alternaria ventricosa]|uniref:uncharacterized protein n=1 Tax=Alternaria ventricosa TaxID=1187951 RepID=UPI0020C28C9D|nr:uncharacterized protein J4E93_005008 [Alternaria ventricosa]KAI4646784.1 hypothetical protein J4E93_005008 [Alternaria ventricosa]